LEHRWYQKARIALKKASSKWDESITWHSKEKEYVIGDENTGSIRLIWSKDRANLKIYKLFVPFSYLPRINWPGVSEKVILLDHCSN